MKAAVLYANDDLRYVEVATPAVRAGTVKVRVRASGICGSDVPRVLGGGAHYYPIILGHEFAGDVVEVGEGVSGLRVGDSVSGAPLVPCMACSDCQLGQFALCKHYSFIGSRQPGSFADYVVLPAANAVRYDGSIPYTQAAMFEPSTVALHGIFRARYRGGKSVAVLGSGTIGIFTLQWARMMGAKQIAVFDVDDRRLDLARRMGADKVFNTKKDGFLPEALDWAGEQGFGYVFEAAGNPATIRLSFQLAGNRADICMIGTPHAPLSFAPEAWEAMNRKEFRLTGSWMSYSAPFPGKEWELTAHAFATGKLRFDSELIGHTYPMREAAQAFALFHHPEQVHGKVMLVNEGEESD